MVMIYLLRGDSNSRHWPGRLQSVWCCLNKWGMWLTEPYFPSMMCQVRKGDLWCSSAFSPLLGLVLLFTLWCYLLVARSCSKQIADVSSCQPPTILNYFSRLKDGKIKAKDHCYSLHRCRQSLLRNEVLKGLKSC